MNTRTSVSTASRVLFSKRIALIGWLVTMICSLAMSTYAVDFNFKDRAFIDDTKKTGIAMVHTGRGNSVAAYRGNMVAAYRARDGFLGLTSFRVSADGDLTTLAQEGSGERITGVDLVHWDHSRDRLVAATSGERHQVKVWGLENNGNMSPLGDSGSQAGASQLSLITQLSSNIFLTAVKTSEDNLKLITWEISDDGRTVKRLRDSGAQAGRAREFAMVKLSRNWVVTAIRTRERKLMLISWDISTSGYRINRRGDITAEEAQHLSMVKLTPFRVLVSMANSSNRLKLTAWDVNTSDRGQITHAVSALSNHSGGVKHTQMAVYQPFGNPLGVATAVIADNKRSKLITWDVPSRDNAPILWTGDRRIGSYRNTDLKIAIVSDYLVHLFINDKFSPIIFTDYEAEITTYSIE